MLLPPANSPTVNYSNQQTNQLLGGGGPNWRGLLGTGTTGGGVNLKDMQQQNGPLGSPNPRVAMMIRALMQRGGGL